jgi:hypothetical protein
MDNYPVPAARAFFIRQRGGSIVGIEGREQSGFHLTIP